VERITTHAQHSNISKITSFCRNRRRENSTKLTEEQQKIHALISVKTDEFQKKIKNLQLKISEVRNHVRQTKRRLNSLHHHLD
jgi:hypothetical protein